LAGPDLHRLGSILEFQGGIGHLLSRRARLTWRTNQENHIAQLKELRALHSPVDTLESNWAYMVMAEKHEAEKDTVLKMEVRTFLNAFIRIPVQIVRTGRRIVYRLLGWNRWQHVFLRGLQALRLPALC